MKKCFKTNSPKARGNFSFFRYFNTDKSRHTQINPLTRTYEYYPKHPNVKGLLVWSSANRGTYVRAIHGELTTKKLR